MQERGGRNEPYEPAPHEPNPYAYQPPAPPAAKPRPRWRTPLIAAISLIAGIIIGAAAAGGSKNNDSPTSAGTTPAASSPNQQATPVVVHSSTAPPPAAPAKRVALKLSGNGIKSTKQFTITHDDWSLAYTYDCSNAGGQGNFIVSERGGGNDGVALVNALGTMGSDISYQHADSGTHFLEINSECDWAVTVTDGDGG